MTEREHTENIPLYAKNPFELRVNLGRDIPETDVRTALATGDMGFLHSFTTGSTVDGPGVRVVAWTTGCQFRCLYCHNPDTWTMSNGIPITIEKAAAELRKYRTGLKAMSGGFTLSGGEPLMQDRFAVKLFAAARSMGIHTALDTNGSLGGRLTDAELETIDLVLLDIKSWDTERHRRLTGMDVCSSPVLRSPLSRLQKACLGTICIGSGVHRRFREHSRDCKIRCQLRQCRTSGRSTVSSNGPI